MGAAKKREVNIEQVIKKTAQETVKELEKARLLKSDGSTLFQKTEKLLYNYPNLKEAVKQKEKDIEYLQKYGPQNRSKSIVFYTTGGTGKREEEEYAELLEAYKAAKERTERLIHKIERAIKSVENDEYYKIIELRYFTDEKLDNSEIGIRLNISERTVRRHKNKFINKIQVLLFGADALD
ncbi:sigma factor-like helix-turn-helix DNA-binding protein [Natronincola ferrireducens]|uniref:Sigma-70, region 4 n=1 Tax=Natronincola ferrireducens TaxID=393762 RepID=A0A1G9I4W9_9FIRM|nr:sigma factor-like helix-turn-helix DNA-binding protein [Natronincola ferrireducens]SDL19914.1 Sigma-70, region 4 [Natronincola ferrireducens]